MGTLAHTEHEAALESTLREAGARHGDRLVLLCSFQKEESVLVDAVLKFAPETRIVTIDTGVLFEETLQTWKAFEDKFGVHIDVVDASNPENPWSGPQHCCSAAKVAALEKALEGAEGWITGIRREQSENRAGTQLVEQDPKRGIYKYNPLADWTEKDLWAHIFDHELPYNTLHDQGYESIGCAPCTQPGSGRDGRWAGTDKDECGLHESDLGGHSREDLHSQDISPEPTAGEMEARSPGPSNGGPPA